MIVIWLELREVRPTFDSRKERRRQAALERQGKQIACRVNRVDVAMATR
jgi:hypothetical protein